MKIIIYIIVLFISGCVIQDSRYVKDGIEYGVTSGTFRERWWNYYERGLSYSEGGFYDEAVEDFIVAIGQREDDNWRSRTYGMHFVNYFPHREMGIVHFKRGDYTDAELELERSLKTAASAKARYYLNRTRQSILRQTGRDKLQPAITITSPTESEIINKTAITVKGTAEDDFYVSSLLINDIPFPVELSARGIDFEQDLKLKRGTNSILVLATDLTGKTTEKKVNIYVDSDGPTIIIEDHSFTSNELSLSGYITDNTGITSLIINGEPASLMKTAGMRPGEYEFQKELHIDDSTATLTIKGTDVAGNITTGSLSVGQPLAGNYKEVLLASADPVQGESAMSIQTLALSSILKIIDDSPPVIDLKNITDHMTLFTDALYLEGSVIDDSKIISLNINGKPILKRKGEKVFFNYMADLKEGKNILSVSASDRFGNVAKKILTVTRITPAIRSIGSRMSISILPFKRDGEASTAGNTVLDSLISGFITQKRFRLIERERIEAILNELRLAQTELVEPETAAEIGKIAVADAILTGTIYESSNAIEVYTRLVDTETSDIIDAQDVFDEDKSFHGVSQLMKGLALKYKLSLPLLEGTVVERDGRDVLANLGEDKKIKRNMGFIIFREGPSITDPVTKAALGTEPVVIGEAKVKAVYEKFSRASIRKGTPSEIKTRDMVLTK